MRRKNTQRRISARKFTYIRNIYFRLIQTVAQPTETEEGVREWRGNKIGSHQISNMSAINEGSWQEAAGRRDRTRRSARWIACMGEWKNTNKTMSRWDHWHSPDPWIPTGPRPTLPHFARYQEWLQAGVVGPLSAIVCLLLDNDHIHPAYQPIARQGISDWSWLF